MKKRVFITGVTGQDGSYLSELLLDKGYDVFGLVRMSSVNNLKRIEHLVNNPNFHILYGDMTDETSLLRAVDVSKPDEIYNLAAQSHVGLSPSFSEYTTNVNALGFQRLINVVYSLNLQDKVKVYQALTSDIFGNNNEDILNENSIIQPINPYACAKAYAFWLAKSYRQRGLFVVNGIAFAHESKRRPEIFVTRKITKAAVRIVAGKQEKLSLGNLSVRRDWVHAKDVVEGMWLSLQQDSSNDYVFATGNTTSIREFCIKTFNQLNVELVFIGEGNEEKAFDKKTGRLVIDIDPQFSRPLEKPNPVGDYSRAKNILNWTPKYNIDDIIGEMVKEDLKEENISFVNV